MSFLGAFLGILLLGAVIYWKIWWEDGSNIGWKFMKWYFALFFVVALITGGIAHFAF
ncbi:hypothetical protein ACFQZE_15020 [Paenibacillus sp. GCM10027627]|uniref:hypothetical protein n=1 Tax=unclassified Paenibacillus TaxID=185978 RepID=UPI00363A53AC